MVVKPNCAYIIPPNRDMALLNGTLQLLEPAAPRGHRLPIDFFFRSLAQDQRERAIGIVLSGTGSDGTQGVQGGQGRGRHGDGADTRIHRIRRHAPQRYCHRHGGLCATSKRDARQLLAYVAHAFGENHPSGLSRRPPSPKTGWKKSFSCLRVPDRSRFFSIQTEHHRPPRRAAYGGAPDRAAGRLSPLYAAEPGAKWTRSFANS
jgi:two-component system CheB/CheR fusion protein